MIPLFRPISFTLSTDHNPNLRQTVLKLNTLHYKAASTEKMWCFYHNWKNNLEYKSVEVKSLYSYINIEPYYFFQLPLPVNVLTFFSKILLKHISLLVFKSFYCFFNFFPPLNVYLNHKEINWWFFLLVFYLDLEL